MTTRVLAYLAAAVLAASCANPLRAGEPPVYQYWSALEVKEDADAVAVRGKSFEYVMEKKTGLMTSAKALGDEFLAKDARLPDLFVSPESDARKVRFEARHSPSAEVTVKRRPDLVVVTARGCYADAEGKLFGMRYELTYAIEFDGFVKVTVKNVATEDGAVRWVCFNRARLNPEHIDFWSRDRDLAKDVFDGPGLEETQGVALTDRRNRVLFGGAALPFMHFGNARTGIEFEQGDFTNAAFGYKDGEAGRYGQGRDAMGFRYRMTEAYEREGAYELQMMSVRDSYVPVRRGWSRENAFCFMVTPSKETRQDLEQMRVYWLGPHQHRPGFRLPDEAFIRELALKGINVIIGGANYRSGDYSHPDNPDELRAFLATCHGYGIRVLPYVTFSDIEHDVPVAKDHLEEWMAEPKTEYRYLSTLMCFGCKGWREYWRGEVTRLFAQFDFDGLYIDMWCSTLGCMNQRHGCSGRVKTYNIEGLREFGKIAREIVAKGRDDRFIIANVGENYWSAFCGLIDVRLVGENTRLQELSPGMLRVVMDSRREGCQTLLLTRNVKQQNLLSFSLAYDSAFPINPGERRRAGAPEAGQAWSCRDVFRAFGVNRAKTFSSLHDNDVIYASVRECSVTAWARDGELLVALSTLAEKPVRARVVLKDAPRLGLRGEKYRLFDPLKREFLDPAGVTLAALEEMEFEVDPSAPLLLLMRPEGGEPLLFVTGADGAAAFVYSSVGRRLGARLAGIEGAPIRITIENRRPILSVSLGGKDLGEPSSTGAGTVTYDATLPADARLNIIFGN